MKKLIINGNKPLYGHITPSGSKNAALPILFATIITSGVSEIRSLPDIGDVRITLDILRSLGALIERVGDVTYIDTENMVYNTPDRSLVSKIRASTYLIGSMLSRFGKCPIPEYGGCSFAHRPIDMHLDAARALGCTIEDGLIKSRGLYGTTVRLKKPSVGATVNSILLGVTAVGETLILGRAREGHIDNLIEYLRSAGAEIETSENYIKISGRRLHGGRVTIDGDLIEAASYLGAGLISSGEVTVDSPPQREQLRDMFSSIGAEVIEGTDFLSVRASSTMRYASITAAPYPGFPTDLQPIFAPILARFSGGVIEDLVFPTRFGYLDELKKLGVESRVCDGKAFISPSAFTSGCAQAIDLRGGMAATLAALFAKGRSVITSADIILRGYERLEEKLSTIGADVIISD